MSVWIRQFFPVPQPDRRLICFPHAGGSASAYRAMAESLADSRTDVLIVQYPGRQDRLAEPAAEGLGELIDELWSELLPVLADGRPFGLFGHSMGALLAFEAARRLERAERVPAALFVSACRGPSSTGIGSRARTLAEASDETLVDELRLLGGSVDELLAHPGLLEIALPAIRSDFRMLGRYAYQPGAPLACPLISLVGDEDPRVPVEEMESWRSETSGPYAAHVLLGGGHFYLDDHLPAVRDIVGAAPWR
ncbi:thioesterase II family protein [Streptomyces exfoliatus]|uniref:thioesterase II family protein n=1 Tax=Streptomyces exfoliatus TaxID=1905 RepID=UPI0005681A8B|nr:alpha/beta fold hydrolase [Streptomyces exfoliatus]